MRLFLYNSNVIILTIVPVLIGIVTWVIGDKSQIKLKIILGAAMFAAAVFVFCSSQNVKTKYVLVPDIQFGKTTLERGESLLRSAGIFYNRTDYYFTQEVLTAVGEDIDYSNPNLVIMSSYPQPNTLMRNSDEITLSIGWNSVSDTLEPNASSETGQESKINTTNTPNSSTSPDLTTPVIPTIPISKIISETMLKNIDKSTYEVVTSSTIDISVTEAGLKILSPVVYDLEFGSNAIEGAIVCLINYDTQESIQVQTDASGTARFSNIEDGLYYHAVFISGILVDISDHVYKVEDTGEFKYIQITIPVRLDDGVASDEFYIRFFYYDGNVASDIDVFFELTSDSSKKSQNQMLWGGKTDKNGYLSGWTMRDGVVNYEIVSFSLYEGYTIQLETAAKTILGFIRNPIMSNEMQIIIENKNS